MNHIISCMIHFIIINSYIRNVQSTKVSQKSRAIY